MQKKLPYHLFFKVDTTLKSMYNNLQRLAAGLEQVVQDQNTYEGKYLEEFSEAEFKLKAVSHFFTNYLELNEI